MRLPEIQDGDGIAGRIHLIFVRVLSIAISQCANTQRHADLPKCIVPSIANIARGYRLDRDRKST